MGHKTFGHSDIVGISLLSQMQSPHFVISSRSGKPEVLTAFAIDRKSTIYVFVSVAHHVSTRDQPYAISIGIHIGRIYYQCVCNHSRSPCCHLHMQLYASWLQRKYWRLDRVQCETCPAVLFRKTFMLICVVQTVPQNVKIVKRDTK
jgi:hypothetical protein